MIKAKHTKWAEFVFEKYLDTIFKKSFSDINLIGDIPEISNDDQLIVLPNHSTWWDGFFVWYLNKILFQRKFYIMMLESRLKKYNFFSKLGAFSIDQNNPKSIIETFSYINTILQSKDRIILNYYPQGELLPNIIRPIKIQPGILKIIRNFNGNLSIIPLGIRAEFLGDRLPYVFFNLGKPIDTKKEESAIILDIQSSIEDCLKTIEFNIINNKLGRVIFKGKKSPK
jgi:1-acyl-sn-glycerol-3-phosphate acyltransferase